MEGLQALRQMSIRQVGGQCSLPVGTADSPCVNQASLPMPQLSTHHLLGPDDMERSGRLQ
jgi:hypothetical protein